MLTADQAVALLMVIADQRIELANANGEIAMLRKLVPTPPEVPKQEPESDGG